MNGKMVFFWSHAPAVVRTLDLEGREEVLLAIPEGWWHFYPIEGPYLICCTPDGVAVIDLRTQERRVMIVRTADGASRKLMVANSLAGMKWDGWQVVTTSPV